MRIINANVNGIRSAARKGLFAWLNGQDAECICLQEIKAEAHHLTADSFSPHNFHAFFESAIRPGYSGVALYCRRAPDAVLRGFGSAEFDPEGRYLEARFGDVSVVSVYVPSGTSSEARLAAKFRFLDEFMVHLKKLRVSGRRYLLCGDWNIAHRAIDLKNWRANQKNSGFLPQERAWLDELLVKEGFVDAFREVNQEPEQYTWWSNRGQAYAKNVGWRIDYQVLSPILTGTVRGVEIYKETRFSDHAPLCVDYNFELP